MRYLTFIRSSESYRESSPPPALMEAMGKLVERSLKEGTLGESEVRPMFDPDMGP
jgi:hypothetical protein